MLYTTFMSDAVVRHGISDICSAAMVLAMFYLLWRAN